MIKINLNRTDFQYVWHRIQFACEGFASKPSLCMYVFNYIFASVCCTYACMHLSMCLSAWTTHFTSLCI